MGYGVSRISPITFNDNAFQMLSNRAKDRALTLTPRKKRNETNTGSTPTTQTPQQDGNAKSYNADLSVAGTMVQMGHLAGLCLHNPITQVVLHKRWTTLTQQQCIMRSQMGNVKTSLPVYKCHCPRTCCIYRNYHHYPNHKSKSFTGWWNPNHTTTIPQEVYINRRDTNISLKR